MDWKDLEEEWRCRRLSGDFPHHCQTPFHHTDILSSIYQSQENVRHFAKDWPDLVSFLTTNYLSLGKIGKPEVNVDAIPVHEALYDLYTEGLQKIQAPMVRCSRPAFRRLTRRWGTTINYSHMIVASSFVQSSAARHADFGLYEGEERLVVQVAATSGPTAAEAAVLLSPYSDAIDLNCGCPQRWAIQEGFGAALLEKPELVSDCIRSIHNAMAGGSVIEYGGGSPVPGGRRYPCTVKMRLMKDIRKSVEFARQCEAAGAAWITVHGRTPTDPSSSPVQHDGIQLIAEHLSIPVVANGGVSSPSSALALAFLSGGVGSVMSGTGLLDNPACFSVFPSGEALFHETSYPLCSSTAAPGIQDALQKEVRDHLHTLARPNLGFNTTTGKGVYHPQWSVTSSPVFSLFWTPPLTPVEVISDYIRLAIQTDLAYPTTVQQVVHMARPYLSATERSYLSLLRSNIAVWRALQQLGLYTERGRYSLP